MEDVNKLFEKFVKDEVITEEAQKNLAVVFEAYVSEAVNAKVAEETKAIMEQMDSKFEEVVSEHKADTQNKLNDYMKHIVSEFVSENKVKIQNDIVVEKAVKIIDGVQKVFEENGIKLPESNAIIVEELNNKNTELKAECNKLMHKNMELVTAVEEAEKAVAFMKGTEGLSLVSKEKLLRLMTGLVVESAEDFKEKLETLKSSVVTEAKKKVTKEEDDEESKDDEKKSDDSEDVGDEVEESDEEDAEEKKKKDAEVASEEVTSMLKGLKKFRK